MDKLQHLFHVDLVTRVTPASKKAIPASRSIHSTAIEYRDDYFKVTGVVSWKRRFVSAGKSI